MYVFPDGVRNDCRMPGGGSPDAGVTGDPTLASHEIGQMVVKFKVGGAATVPRAHGAPTHRTGSAGRWAGAVDGLL